jgi:hypothetical protein
VGFTVTFLPPPPAAFVGVSIHASGTMFCIEYSDDKATWTQVAASWAPGDGSSPTIWTSVGVHRYWRWRNLAQSWRMRNLTQGQPYYKELKWFVK